MQSMAKQNNLDPYQLSKLATHYRVFRRMVQGELNENDSIEEEPVPEKFTKYRAKSTWVSIEDSELGKKPATAVGAGKEKNIPLIDEDKR